MINYVIINGVNSNTKNGLMINELPPITKPSMRTNIEEIDGRDGDIITKLGYSAYDKTITIGLWGTSYDVNDIIAFFNKEGVITFSNEPDKYYKFTMLEQIDIERLLKFKTASITFHCQPFKYPTEETPIEIAYEYVEQDNVESANMTNTEGDTFLKIDLKGNTSQYTTTGKNKLSPINVASASDGGVTLTNNNGVYKLNGATSSSSGSNITKSLSSNYTIQSGDYLHIGNSVANGSVSIGLLNNGTQVSAPSFSEVNRIVSLNDKAGQTINQLRIYTTSNQSVNMDIKPMICNISSATDFEPYTNGASPNPSYPQPINVVSGDNEINVCGKNLLPINSFTTTGSGDIFSNYPIILEAGNYMVSFNLNITSTKDMTLRFDYEDGTNFATAISSGTTQKQITLSKNAIKLTWYVREAYTMTNVMLERGDTKTTYEPYNGDTYEIDLGVENLVNAMQESFTLPASETTYQKIISNTSADNKVHLVANTKYYISYTIGNASTSNTRSTPRLYLDSSNYYQKTETNRNITAGRKVEEYTPTTTGDYSVEYWLQGSNVDVVVSDYMISTENASFTPYGTPPIKMRGIGTYEDYFTKNSGKNLFNYATAIRNKTFTSQDVVSDSTGLFISDYIKVEPNTAYYVNENAPVVLALDKDKNSLGYIRNVTTAGTFTTPNNCEYIRIRANNTTIPMETAISKAMLNIGSSAEIYEPYGTGQWCKYNAIGKVVLDGSQNIEVSNWRASETSVGWLYPHSVVDSIVPSTNLQTGLVIADKLKEETYKALYDKSVDNGIGLVNSNAYSFAVRTSNTSLTNNTAINNYLSNNPITILVALATPYLSLIEDETLISQLDTIEGAMSYEGTTNVNQINNDKPFLLDLKAMKKDTNETIVNNIGNTTSKPTIALEGTGDINIYLNGTQMLKATLTDKMTIDTTTLEAYNPDTMTLLNRHLVGDISKFTLNSGENTIKMDGDLTKATITDYTRWL